MQQPLKICHLLSSLKIGGAERFVIDLTIQQIKNGYDVTILSFGTITDELYSVAIKENIKVFLLNKRWYSKNITTYNLLKNFNILHIHSPVTLKAILLPLLFVKKTKIVYTRHGEGKYNSSLWKVVHLVSQPFISSITFVSKNGQLVFNNIHGWKNKKQSVIENGISPPVFPQPPIYENKLKLGSVGRMVDLKKQNHLIRAWSQLDNKVKKNIELHFIGDGECREKLEQLANKDPLVENIVFHGFMNERNEIQSLFDVLVVTSESEGLSIAILEAMIEKKAVIATNVGGTPSLVKDQNTGVLYPFGDIDTLSKAIEDYSKDSGLAKKHGTRAFKHVTENYSILASMEQYSKLYHDQT